MLIAGGTRVEVFRGDGPVRQYEAVGHAIAPEHDGVRPEAEGLFGLLRRRSGFG